MTRASKSGARPSPGFSSKRKAVCHKKRCSEVISLRRMPTECTLYFLLLSASFSTCFFVRCLRRSVQLGAVKWSCVSCDQAACMPLALTAASFTSKFCFDFGILYSSSCDNKASLCRLLDFVSTSVVIVPNWPELIAASSRTIWKRQHTEQVSRTLIIIVDHLQKRLA